MNDLRKTLDPWRSWLLLGTALALASYSTLPFILKSALVILCVLLPMVLIVWGSKGGSYVWDPKLVGETFSIGKTAGIVLVLLLIATRFWGLTDSPPWFLMDEGRNAYFGMELRGHWDWRLLWGSPQEEPLLNWTLGLFFHVLEPSFLNVRIFSAVVSLLTIAAGYWAARGWFPRSTAFLLAVLLGFCFWPFTFSRLLLRVTLLLLLEFIVLGLLARYLKGTRRRWILLTLLAMGTGLGFYTYTAWLPIAVFVTAVLFWGDRVQKKVSKSALIFFVLLSIAIVWPLFAARLQAGGTDFVRSCFRPTVFFSTLLEYLAGIFTDGSQSVPYGPNWGGLLNPLLGAFAGVGLLVLIVRVDRQALYWSGAAFLLSLLPGVVTGNVEMHRVTAAMPVVLWWVCCGIETVLGCWASNKRVWIGLFLFAVSAGLDLYHFTGPYQDWNALPEDKREWRSVERQRAFEVLQKFSAAQGPIVLLEDIYPGTLDQTLRTAVYPFDPSLNPKVPFEKCGWVAVLLNSDYENFLKPRFPGSQWTWLAPDKPNRNGGLMLGLIPRTGENQKILDRWYQADQFLRGTTSSFMHHQMNEEWGPVRESIRAHYSLFQGDPMLESAFWEKIGLVDSMDRHLDLIVEDCRQALRYGYPAANLYNELGVYLMFQGKKAEARENFEKAIHCPVNHTPAAYYLKRLLE